MSGCQTTKLRLSQMIPTARLLVDKACLHVPRLLILKLNIPAKAMKLPRVDVANSLSCIFCNPLSKLLGLLDALQA